MALYFIRFVIMVYIMPGLGVATANRLRAKRQPQINEAFGNWTVLNPIASGKNETTRCLCRCKCGHENLVRRQALLNGRSKNCRKCARSELAPGEAAGNEVYKNYQTAAYKRGLSFELDRETFAALIARECHYCGAVKSNCYRGNRYQTKKLPEGFRYNGLDRLDNNIGYVLENVVPCCKNCNLAKRALSPVEFIGLARAISLKHAA